MYNINILAPVFILNYLYWDTGDHNILLFYALQHLALYWWRNKCQSMVPFCSNLIIPCSRNLTATPTRCLWTSTLHLYNRHERNKWTIDFKNKDTFKFQISAQEKSNKLIRKHNFFKNIVFHFEQVGKSVVFHSHTISIF